jgi:hypothetical protein
VAKPSGDHIPLGGFVRSMGEWQRSIQMISSSSRRGSKRRTPKLVTSPADLAKRFVELQRLREQVHELEHFATIDRQQKHLAFPIDETRRRK